MRIDRVVSDVSGKRSPSVMTRHWCGLSGMTEGFVERWAGVVRIDLFGFADHVAFDKKTLCFIQSTSASNRAARVKKVLANVAARQLCAMGHRILIVTWQRKADKLHHGTIVELDDADFREVVDEANRGES